MRLRILLLLTAASATRATSTSRATKTEPASSPSTPAKRLVSLPRPLPTALLCRNLCGTDSECKVEGREVICSCPPGTSGDPKKKCVDLPKITTQENGALSSYTAVKDSPLPTSEISAFTNVFQSGYQPLLRLYNIHPNYHGSVPFNGVFALEPRTPQHGPVYFTSSPFYPLTSFFPAKSFQVVNSPQESSSDNTERILQFETQVLPLKKIMYKLPSLGTQPSEDSSRNHNKQGEVVAPVAITIPSVPVVAPLNFAYNFHAQYQ